MNIHSFFRQYFYEYWHLIKNDHKYISAIQTWLFFPPRLVKWKVYTVQTGYQMVSGAVS